MLALRQVRHSFARTAAASVSARQVASIRSTDIIKELASGGLTYVDLRTPKEQLAFGLPEVPSFATVTSHVEGQSGRVFNADAWLEKLQENFPRDSKLVLACRSGVRSKEAWELAASSGYQDILELDDGFVGWVANKFPTKKMSRCEKLELLRRCRENSA